MESALEKKKRKFRALYELLFSDYRILNYQISEKLGFRAVSKVLEEARRNQYIIGPETRKCSHANTLEYIYFFNTEEPDITYMKYREDLRVIYNAQLYVAVRSKLDAFQGRDPERAWGWFVQATRKLTNRDFGILTRDQVES